MKAFFDDRQRAHDPKMFMVNGTRLPNPEQPARIEALRAGAEAAGCTFAAPTDHGPGPLAALHSPEYLVFLQTIHTRWSRIAGAADEVIPNIHPDRRTASYPRSAVGQAGFHQADTACPIAAGTWDAAYWSAQAALTAADVVLAGERAAYALCRPPGHHAFGDLAGGFCFLNNSAIAAEAMLRAGRRPAILDVDVHHGNGTQGIFYARADVLTVSIHADPARFYPFFWGHAEERGTGAGLGYNLNLALPRGTDDASYLEALDIALARIRAFGTDALVVALGLDAHEGDPFQGFRVTTPGFARIAGAIAGLGLPSVIVQEGGYLQPALGANLTSFLKGFGG
ncbi:MAG: histone deacetylase family protein [Rhodobacteraceae bacterium]|jgi:acetoin utilization deacetylase AcuC-like enzyme|nr:histone deacetylase family protein [uncultured Defluviimonas sp.]MCB2124794.1 histone deacetylase family protein [Paracoccaceae bacterium]MCC0070533.1 histone deacetylase family protein [Paracoccaceae bacterium]